MLHQSALEAAPLRPTELESSSLTASSVHHSPTYRVLNWYRVLVTANTLVFGLWKTVASYHNQNIVSTTVDWLGAVLLSLLFFWVSECRTLAYTRWLFERQPTSDVYRVSSLVSRAIKCYVVAVLPTTHHVLIRSMRRLPRRPSSDGELPLPVLSGLGPVQGPMQDSEGPQQLLLRQSVQVQVPPAHSTTGPRRPQNASPEPSVDSHTSAQPERRYLAHATGAEQLATTNSMRDHQTQVVRLRRPGPQDADTHTATLLTLFLPLSAINQTLSLASQFDAIIKQRFTSEGRSKSLQAIAGPRARLD